MLTIEQIKKLSPEKKFEKFQDLLEYIDDGYGFGPSEVIDDPKKINQYIDNFFERYKGYGISEHFYELLEGDSHTLEERLLAFKD